MKKLLSISLLLSLGLQARGESGEMNSNPRTNENEQHDDNEIFHDAYASQEEREAAEKESAQREEDAREGIAKNLEKEREQRKEDGSAPEIIQRTSPHEKTGRVSENGDYYRSTVGESDDDLQLTEVAVPTSSSSVNDEVKYIEQEYKKDSHGKRLNSRGIELARKFSEFYKKEVADSTFGEFTGEVTIGEKTFTPAEVKQMWLSYHIAREHGFDHTPAYQYFKQVIDTEAGARTKRMKKEVALHGEFGDFFRKYVVGEAVLPKGEITIGGKTFRQSDIDGMRHSIAVAQEYDHTYDPETFGVQSSFSDNYMKEMMEEKK